MNTRILRHEPLRFRATALAMFLCVPWALAGDAIPPWPPGIVDFAGRVARNHWSLFKPEDRAELETLNRELRVAQRRLDQASTEDARRAAANRGATAADRLLQLVKTSPRLVRVDLASVPPALKPAGLIELPGDNGGFLFEVVSGGEEVSYVTTVLDLSQAAG